MNIDIKFNLYQSCWIMKGNKPVEFTPKAMKIECVYSGYSGSNWGDESAGPGRGWPLVVYYSDDPYGDNKWVPQCQVFETKDALIRSLI